jgi:hypothetical protein
MRLAVLGATGSVGRELVLVFTHGPRTGRREAGPRMPDTGGPQLACRPR